MEKAARNPTAVIRPVQAWVRSNASGIMVSASMARIAPAAMAVMTAMGGRGVAQRERADQRGESAGHRDAAPHPEDVFRAPPGAFHPGSAGQALGNVGDGDRGQYGHADAAATEQRQAQDHRLRDAVQQRTDGDCRPAPGLLQLRGLLALRTLAVPGPAACQRVVRPDVHHGAGDEPDDGGGQAALPFRLVDQFERQSRDQHSRPERHDGGNDLLRDRHEPGDQCAHHQGGAATSPHHPACNQTGTSLPSVRTLCTGKVPGEAPVKRGGATPRAATRGSAGGCRGR